MNPKVDFSSDWRFNDGQMHARQFCLNAFIQHRINLTRDVYEFEKQTAFDSAHDPIPFSSSIPLS